MMEYKDWLYLRALRRGYIRIDDELNETEVATLLLELDEMDERGLTEIRIGLNSPGGNVYHSFAAYDALKRWSASGGKITIFCEGCVASAAVMILLQAADERIARPNCRFLFHEVRRWAFDKVERASELQDEAKELRILTNMIVKLLAERSGKSERSLQNLITRKETWLSAEDALKRGFIDAIF